MAEFILSAFADEIDPMLDKQMVTLRRCNIHHIELRGVDGRNISEFTVEEALALKGRLANNGIRPSALGTPVGKIGIEEDFAPHFDMYLRMLDVAEAMDCPYMRIFSFFIPEDQAPAQYKDEVLARMEKFVTAAQGRKVQLLHENEKFIYGDVPGRCLEMLTAFPTLGATYDPSNFVQCDVDNKQAFRQLTPYIRYMHIKDSIYTEQRSVREMDHRDAGDVHRLAGEGDGNIMWILTELKKSGYKGFLSLEPHLSHYDGVAGTAEEKFIAAYEALHGLVEQL